jgi:hypothetical protein
MGGTKKGKDFRHISPNLVLFTNRCIFKNYGEFTGWMSE